MAKKKQSKPKDKKKPKKRLGLAKFIQPSKPRVKAPKDEVEDEERFDNRTATNASKKKVHSNMSTTKSNLSLIERCKLQMSSSMLRLIDEDLYVNDTKNIPLDKEKFKAYHDAYDAVSKNWPSKPIDYIVKYIKRRIISQKPVSKFKFADIGCGSKPLLKMKLPAKAKVKSFDLVSAHKEVIEANMEKLPVDDESFTCIVYSLSLMAKNLGDILLEGKRVLKVGGSMLIVEVTSRFEGKEKKFVSKLERIGFKHKTSTPLEPNGYFTFFHFTKLNSELNYHKSSTAIELKPCVYKAR